MFLKGLHIIPLILAAMFYHNTSGYDMLFSVNVLKMLKTKYIKTYFALQMFQKGSIM